MKAGLATSLSIAGVLATGGAALVLNSSILDTESSAKGSPAFATVVGIEAQGGITPLGDGATPGSVAELSAQGVADLVTGQGAPLAEPLVIAPQTESATTTPGSQSNTAASGSGSSSANGAAAGSSGGIKQTQANLAATETTEAPSPTSVAPAPTTSAPVVAPTTIPVPPAPTTTAAPSVEKQFKVGDAATITLVINGTKLLVKDIAITPGSGYNVTNQTSRDGDDVRITLTSPTRVLEFSARLVNGQVVAAVSAPSSGNLTPPPPPRRHDDDGDERDDEHEGREHEEREREHDDDD